DPRPRGGRRGLRARGARPAPAAGQRRGRPGRARGHRRGLPLRSGGSTDRSAAGRGRRAEGPMKLCLLTYNLARNWELPKLIAEARRLGFAALELRADARHAHGVELDLSKQQRREVRDRVEDAYLEVACIGTGNRFESPELAARQEQIDRVKRFVEL